MAKHGVVYVIRNDEHVPDRYKVGQTYDLDRRLSELNRETSNVGTFRPIAVFPVSDADAAERHCHDELASYRKAKEFFDGPEEKIVAIVQDVTKDYQPQAFVRDTKKLREEQIRIEDEAKAALAEKQLRVKAAQARADEAQRQAIIHAEEQRNREIKAEAIMKRVNEEMSNRYDFVPSGLIISFFCSLPLLALDRAYHTFSQFSGLGFSGDDGMVATLVLITCAVMWILYRGRRVQREELIAKYARDEGISIAE